MTESRVNAIPDADVVFTELDNGEAVLLHLGTHCYYSLNTTGAYIWHLLEKRVALSEIPQHLQSVFDVNEQQARQSILDLVSELAAEKLVSLDDDPSTAVA